MICEGWAINMKQTTKTANRQHQQQNEQMCVVTILGMMGYFSNRNVGIVKEERDQITGINYVTIFHPIFSVLVKNNEKLWLIMVLDP